MNEKSLVNETGYDLLSFSLRISPGYSSARNFPPVVKFTPLPSNNTINRSILLMDLDWYEFALNYDLQTVGDVGDNEFQTDKLHQCNETGDLGAGELRGRNIP
ncbi:hypothetical protein JTB14_035249 [Gonioctena quinquepunctata]|nr:hypothetical protein JTB14_035249 [Gonioctena quinquepunctata]